MSLYEKKIVKDSFEYQFYKSLGFPPIEDSDLVLRITLDDMELIDGLYIPLPIEAEFLSLEKIIEKYIIYKSDESQNFKEYFSRYQNPDLADIIAELGNIYEKQKAGKIGIKYHINNGNSNIQPNDPIYLYQQFHVTDDQTRVYKLLDIVIETYNKIDPFHLVTKEQKNAMLDDFRQVFLLYSLDKFGHFPDINNIQPEIAKKIYTILNKLSSNELGLIQSNDNDWQVSYKGYELIRNILDEVEFYIDNFDIFGDVYIKNFEDILFNTGYGNNLIIPVFLREGINPYRALFLSAIYFGNLDELLSDVSKLFSDDIFRQIFMLIADSQDEEEIGSDLLTRIIIEGKTKTRERNLKDERLKSIENINKRINSL